ncbi:hypothetical protein Q8A67_023416 [Cirrhinus molitorella]|uniref:Uncharacterized protein n=1 Tax=Cirrhinus molitorella TaxID=172907 RepID=A0AA88P3E8_9TELE|nr:hypothetical protein Q8A67_023416 [Cirrhinus molitorella]
MTCTVGGQIIPQLNVEEATEDSSSPSRSISSRRSKTSFSPFSSRKHQSSGGAIHEEDNDQETKDNPQEDRVTWTSPLFEVRPDEKFSSGGAIHEEDNDQETKDNPQEDRVTWTSPLFEVRPDEKFR